MKAVFFPYESVFGSRRVLFHRRKSQIDIKHSMEDMATAASLWGRLKGKARRGRGQGKTRRHRAWNTILIITCKSSWAGSRMG
jgi:hypothetical protein